MSDKKIMFCNYPECLRDAQMAIEVYYNEEDNPRIFLYCRVHALYLLVNYVEVQIGNIVDEVRVRKVIQNE